MSRCTRRLWSALTQNVVGASKSVWAPGAAEEGVSAVGGTHGKSQRPVVEVGAHVAYRGQTWQVAALQGQQVYLLQEDGTETRAPAAVPQRGLLVHRVQARTGCCPASSRFQRVAAAGRCPGPR
jgi:hypothetical protein